MVHIKKKKKKVHIKKILKPKQQRAQTFLSCRISPQDSSYKYIFSVYLKISSKEKIYLNLSSTCIFNWLGITKAHAFKQEVNQIRIRIYPEPQRYTQTSTCTHMFIVPLFTKARRWKQPNYSAVDEWIKYRGTYT